MRILSVGKPIEFAGLSIEHIDFKELSAIENIETVDYIIISGGDGMIRRVLGRLKKYPKIPSLILNPIGSFNVVAKLHRSRPLTKILKALKRDDELHSTPQKFYYLNDEIFLFSAGNMGDLQHIFISETLRFGLLKQGSVKYLIAFIFLLPMHFIFTPFMLMSKTRFFIFTPFKAIKKFGSFYGKVPQSLTIDLGNDYNIIELDGDIVMINDQYLNIGHAGSVEIIK